MEKIKDYATTASAFNSEGNTLTYEKIMEAYDLIKDLKPISTNYAASTDIFKRKDELEKVGFILNEEERQYEYNGIIIKERKYLPDGTMIDMDELRRQAENITNNLYCRR